MTSLTNRIAAVQACLNGSRSPAEHAAVPVTAAELAAAAASAVAAGAGSLHLHPRQQDGSESLRAEEVGAAVAAVRERCPKIPV
ncbi:MAG: 3-keto-5-aminohexanoate cleavage protein [Streptosporangiaceae bacterium]